MNTVKTPFLILLLLASISCQPKNKSNKEDVAKSEPAEAQLETKLTAEQLQDYETAYFASGCFWCRFGLQYFFHCVDQPGIER